MSDQSGGPPGPEQTGAGRSQLAESSRIIADTASDAIITIDQESIIQFVNRAAERIFGYSADEMLGHDLTMLMPDYLRHVHKSGLHRYSQTGQRHIDWEAVALPGLHKQGHEIPLELSFGEYTENGIRYFTGIARDITERRMYEQRLATQYRVTHALAEAPDESSAAHTVLQAVCETLGWDLGVFWRVDAEGNVLRYVQSWQDPLLRMQDFIADSQARTFIPGSGIPGKIWASGEAVWIEDLSADSNFPRAEAALRTGLRSCFGFPIKLGNNTLGIIEFFTREKQSADPALLEMMTTVGSQMGQYLGRKRMEAERLLILDREQRARQAAEVASERIHALQKVTDTSLSYFNLDELLAELLDRIREALHVDTVAILLLQPEGDELLAWAAKGLEEEVEIGVRVPVGRGFAGRVAATGKPVYIEDTAKADLYNPLLRQKGISSLLGVPLLVEGRVTGVMHVGSFALHQFNQQDTYILQLVADRIALAIDNARLYEEERTARNEAEAANRAKDEFLTMLSHELRTPLTPIIGWLHMMQRGVLPQVDFIRGLSVLDRNSQTMKRLINDLLDMSAILTGKMRLEEKPIDLETIVREAIETVRPQAAERDIQLEVLFGDWQKPILTGDRTRLIQTFGNLLTNAVKFSRNGGRINILCDSDTTDATIQIQDFGEGIPAEFVPYVFERFRQADASKTRIHGGLGLGLALVKNFVEGHGGTIEVASDGPGLGATFTVCLPLLNVEIEPAAEPDFALTSGAHAAVHLLIVEDEPDTLEMLNTALRANGYRTSSCSSAAAALEITATKDFDLIISDIGMPEMDGNELMRRLRVNPRLRDTPAIAVSGYAAKKDGDLALAAGFNAHLAKPVDPEELHALVKKLLLNR